MTSVLGLLDDVPPREDPELRRSWDRDVERSLDKHARQWVKSATDIDRSRGWWLLGWVEDVANELTARREDAAVSAAAFAMSLLEASPLDRRDVLVVAALVRRASHLAGLDYDGAVRVGCRRAGDLGQQVLRPLLLTSHDLPSLYEQVGSGEHVSFRRVVSDVGMTEEEALRWFRGES